MISFATRAITATNFWNCLSGIRGFSGLRGTISCIADGRSMVPEVRYPRNPVTYERNTNVPIKRAETSDQFGAWHCLGHIRDSYCRAQC